MKKLKETSIEFVEMVSRFEKGMKKVMTVTKENMIIAQNTLERLKDLLDEISQIVELTGKQINKSKK